MPNNHYLRFETHSHSHFSNIRLLDCINRPKDLLLTAEKLGYAGLCITDHEALCGHVDFLKQEKELKEKNLISQDFKLGLGNEIYLTETRDKSQKYYHFILIAKNDNGHRALRELSSKAWYFSYYDRGLERVPTLKKELAGAVKKYPNSLVGCTACLGGELATLVLQLIEKEKIHDEAAVNEIKQKIFEFLSYGKELFGDDFYVEIAPSKSPDQILFNQRVKGIASALGIKMIFATDAHYLTEKERPIHKAYLNSKEGEREVDSFYSYAHLMSGEEAFKNLVDFSEEEYLQMCKNTLEIKDKIEGYNLFRNPIIPEVQVPYIEKKFISELQSYPTLYKLLQSENLQERYWINTCLGELKNRDILNETYLKRLEIEADIIATISEKLENCLFSYFNTFQHYIELFWDCGSIVGPGRGSAVGFLSNYLMDITQLDPIKWNNPYWRFLNKERIELPKR